MEKINNLLKELDYYWNYYGDDEFSKGIHSKCDEIHEELMKILDKLSDEELVEFCESIPNDKLEQLAYPLDEVSNNHPCIEKYVQY